MVPVQSVFNPLQLSVPEIATLILIQGFDAKLDDRPLLVFDFPKIQQVVQLSLTNPRDALHHGKRQNFKTVPWP